MTVLEAVGVLWIPEGGVPTTDAVFTTLVPSRSAWVTTCEPEQFATAPGLSELTLQLMPVAFGSVTVTPVIVTFPLFVTVNVYGIDAPKVSYFVAVVAFTTVRAVV